MNKDGLSGVSADWLVKNMGLKNIKFTMHGPGCISNAMCVAAQSVGDDQANTVLVLRATGNMPGRYGQYGAALPTPLPGQRNGPTPGAGSLFRR